MRRLVIMRGLPGSGKTTRAIEIAGEDGVRLSTDDFYVENGQFNFDPDKLGEAHRWNRRRARKAFELGLSPVVIDNCNVEPWEAHGYLMVALRYGYKVEVAYPDTPWMFDPAALAEKTEHGVPQGIIENMMTKWVPADEYSVSAILTSR